MRESAAETKKKKRKRGKKKKDGRVLESLSNNPVFADAFYLLAFLSSRYI